MRKLLSILLLALFGVIAVLPVFAVSAGADAGLPACCRRDGKHHCMLNMAERARANPKAVQMDAPMEKCPFGPGSVVTVHPTLLAPAAAAAVSTALVSHPSGVAQTESKWRIARDRSRQKRGPPAASLL